MFKIRSYITEKLTERISEICSHHRHCRQFSSSHCPFNGNYNPHSHCIHQRRTGLYSFFKNNTASHNEVELIENITNQHHNESWNHYGFKPITVSGTYHGQYLHNQLNPHHILYKQLTLNDDNDHSIIEQSSITNPLPINIFIPRRFHSTTCITDTFGTRQFSTSLSETETAYTEPATPINELIQLDKFQKTDLDLNDHDIQEELLLNLERQGRFNEILVHFNYLLNAGFQPSLKIYNKTLNSIHLRETNENLEESLTHLLNTYSSMLNNNVKPNGETYNIVLSTLLNGSITALLELQNFTQGLQYFQVAQLLFEVCDHDLIMNTDFYELYATCSYIFTQDIAKIEQICLTKLGKSNVLNYLLLMKIYINDITKFEFVFKQFKKSAMNDKSLLKHQFDIYQLYIENLIRLNEFDKATMILDQILNQTRDQSNFQSVSSRLISSYLQTLSEYDLQRCHEIFIMFDSLPWLPDLKISSLIQIMNNCLLKQDYLMLMKFWNYSIIRNDFNTVAIQKMDKSFINIILNQNYNNLLIIDSIIATSVTVDTLKPIKFIKETMLKDITLSSDTVLKLLNYMISTKQPELFITNFIINQGYKHENGNEYLSSIIDYVPLSIQSSLTKSNFFKKCCENYKLINDNFYGIYKNLITTWDCQDQDLVPKLQYYYSLIFNELNDLDNYYVEMPLLLQDFKQDLKLKLSN